MSCLPSDKGSMLKGKHLILQRRGLSKRKEFAPMGRKFFRFRVDLSEGPWCADKQPRCNDVIAMLCVYWVNVF